MSTDTALLLMIAATMWYAGFITCGAMIGKTPFWDGVRDGLTLGLKNRPRKARGDE